MGVLGHHPPFNLLGGLDERGGPSFFRATRHVLALAVFVAYLAAWTYWAPIVLI